MEREKKMNLSLFNLGVVWSRDSKSTRGNTVKNITPGPVCLVPSTAHKGNINLFCIFFDFLSAYTGTCDCSYFSLVVIQKS